MGAILLVMRRRKKRLIGPPCSTGPTRWWCRRVFCPRAKPPPPVQAPTPTPALHPTATRSAVPRPLHLTESLMLLPAAPPDLRFLLLFLILLLLSHTRRRRTPARHARPQGPKLADRLWMPNSPPSSSSSSGPTAEELEPKAGGTLRWASSTFSHKVNNWSTRTATPSKLRPQVNTASSDQVMVLVLVLFPHRGAN